MAATIKDKLKIFLVLLVAISATLWLHMERYQKDRVVTEIVRSAISMTNQHQAPELTDNLVAEEGLEPPTRGL